MQIEQYHRRQALLGSAGGAIGRQPNSYAELGRLGEVLTDFGFAAEEQRLRAQYHNQINNAKLAVDQRFLEHQQTLDPNKTEGWLANLESLQQTYGDIKLSNGKAAEDFGAWLEQEKLRQRASIFNFRRATDARNFQADYQVNYRQFMEIAAQQATPGDYDGSVLGSLKSLFGLELKDPDRPIAIENLQTVEGYDNPLFHTEKLRLDQARAWLAGAQQMYEEQQKADVLRSVRDEVMQIPDRAAAEAAIDGLTGVLEQDDRNDLLAQVKRKFDAAEQAAENSHDAKLNEYSVEILTEADPEKLAAMTGRFTAEPAFDNADHKNLQSMVDQQINRLSAAEQAKIDDGDFGQLMYDLVTNPRQVSIERIGQYKADPTRMMQAVRLWADEHTIFKNPAMGVWYERLSKDFGDDLKKHDEGSAKMLDFILQFQAENKRLPGNAEMAEFYDTNIAEPFWLWPWLARRGQTLKKSAAFLATGRYGSPKPIGQRVQAWAAGESDEPTYRLEDPGRPASVAEFEQGVVDLAKLDKNKAKAYYDKWRDLFESE